MTHVLCFLFRRRLLSRFHTQDRSDTSGIWDMCLDNDDVLTEGRLPIRCISLSGFIFSCQASISVAKQKRPTYAVVRRLLSRRLNQRTVPFSIYPYTRQSCAPIATSDRHLHPWLSPNRKNRPYTAEAVSSFLSLSLPLAFSLIITRRVCYVFPFLSFSAHERDKPLRPDRDWICPLPISPNLPIARSPQPCLPVSTARPVSGVCVCDSRCPYPSPHLQLGVLPPPPPPPPAKLVGAPLGTF
jgi:hypothetical protein